MKISGIFVVMLIALMLVGCGSSREAVHSAPDWYLDLPQDPNYIFASASSTSRDMQIAINKAQSDGRNEIAQQLELRMSGLTKRFQEEVGLGEDSELLEQFTNTYKAVVDQVLVGTRPAQREVIPEGNIYRAYVLMEMPIGEANQALMERIRSNQNMYTRFRATEAFKELDEELERYQEWRERQGY